MALCLNQRSRRLLLYVLRRLIRIYTPFICALFALIHGVLFSLLEYRGIILSIMGEIAGHSLLLVMYIWATSKHMCKWYHRTNFLLMMIHVNNLLYYYDIPSWQPVYFSIIIHLLAILSFLAYHTSVGITKLLRL